MLETNAGYISGTAIAKRYKSRDRDIVVLNNANFVFNQGAFAALVGRSGAGKTTLLNLIGGLDLPDSGEVISAGQPLKGMSPKELAQFRAKNIGFIFQSFFLRDGRTALQNVMVPLLLSDVSIRESKARARAALVEVGLESMADSPAGKLSGGQRQRVAIARAVVMRPSIILADEPTGSLDGETAREILDLMMRYNQEQGTTVLLVTHDPLIAKYRIPVYTVAEGTVVLLDEEATRERWGYEATSTR